MPLKITINLENNFCKISDMPFDSILAKLYFQQEINDKTFNGDYCKQLPFLKMSDGIYHTSKPTYQISYIGNETIIKSFNLNMFINLDGDMTHSKTITNISSGRFKKHKIDFEVIFTDKIVYYICANYDVVKELLSNLNYIGKKVSLGWGKIKSLEIEEMEKDFSLYKDNVPNRHLPNLKKYQNKDMKKVFIPLTPPYWQVNDDISLVYSKV